MEAQGATAGSGRRTVASTWILGLIPLTLLAVAAALLALLDGPGLSEPPGPPVEELVVEHTQLHPGEIELTLRNDGPDPVTVSQATVNDAYVPFDGSGEVGRLGSQTIAIPYPWVEGEAYELFLLLSSGGTIDTSIAVATETPTLDLGFFTLMALLGIYVGVIPVSIGMIWLPFVRRIDPGLMRGLIAFTVGLLAFLAIDAFLEGIDIAEEGPQAFGGAALVYAGAIAAYLGLSAVDAHMRARREVARSVGAAGAFLSLLVAVGIGLHNLGEGLAIGSAYAGGALALGAFLVVGFAIHNTTEGLAIVAPLAGDRRRPPLPRLALLGLIAGAPAILGAWIGGAAFNSSVVALLLGVGVGAIAQVIVQLVPSMRDSVGKALTPGTVTGVLAGMAVLYATGLLISV